MRLRLLAAALTATVASAQFHDFAPTADGYALLFSTFSVLKDRPGRTQQRIYRADPAGVHLLIEREYIPAPEGPPQQATFSNYFALTQPQFNSSETVLAYTGTRTCRGLGGQTCLSVSLNQTTVTSLAFGERTFAGQGRLSRNGRYLLTWEIGPPTVDYWEVTDLETGQSQRSRSLGSLGEGRVVADNGIAVSSYAGRLSILQGWDIQAFPYVDVTSATVDGPGNLVAYTRANPEQSSLRTYDVRTATDQVILGGAGRKSQSWISADGSRILFLWDITGETHAWIVDSSGANLRQVSRTPGGVVRAALADNGRVALFLSASGAIHRADIDSGATVEMVGRTAWGPGFSEYFVPGSLVTFKGTGVADGFAAANGFPLPSELAGVRVRAAGVSLPIMAVAPDSVTVQVPWDFPLSAQTVSVDVETAPSSSPFAGSTLANWSGIVRTAQGEFAYNPASPSNFGGSDVLAARENWSGLVDRNNPARPGEIVHVLRRPYGSCREHAAHRLPGAQLAPLPNGRPRHLLDSKHRGCPLGHGGAL